MSPRGNEGGADIRGRPEHGIRRTGVVTFAALAALVLANVMGARGAVTTGQTARPPKNISPPSISGDAREAQIVRGERGKWRRKPKPVEFSYQWELCGTTDDACTPIAHANDRIYALRHDDVGQALRLVVTAANEAGSASAVSARTALVGAAPDKAPQNMLRPAISGKTEKGETLTAQAGTWTGSPPIHVRYRWRRCDDDGGPCDYVDLEDDDGEEGKTYTLRGADVGHALRVLVIAENAVGTSAALSDPTKTIGPIAPKPRATAPKNTSRPTIAGDAQQGKTLTASSGSWTGTAPISFSLQWLRCGGSGHQCASIPGAAAQTYVLGASDVRRTVRVRVSATNSAGTSSAVSDPTRIVVGLRAPDNTSPPRISGPARDGNVLTASTGTWTGAQPIRFSFQWLRCSASGGACAAISRATGQTRALTSIDVGHTMRIRVTAANGAGSSSAISSPSALVTRKGDAPANTARPVLSGTPLQGETLSLATGSWTGTRPITYSYEWVRCGPSLGNCASVAGATGSRYVVVRGDVAHRLVGVVTARNSFGSSRAQSNATPVIVGVPVNTSLPTISGRVMEGEILTVSAGSWTGPGPISFGYQWTRCPAKGDFPSCVPILVTSNPAYRLTAADVGHRLFAQVKALNRFGASFVNSVQTPIVAAAPVGALTIAAVRRVVTYGYRVSLSGVLVNGRQREPVTIIERPVGARARIHSNAASTSPTGVWRYVARPKIRTSYQVQVRGRTSALVTVDVRPRLRLGRVAPGKFSLRVFAARSFAGRYALLQQWNRNRRRWVGIKRIYLRATGLGVEPTVVSRATFRTRADRRRLIRVVLPSRQSGPGYLQGVSNRVRT